MHYMQGAGHGTALHCTAAPGENVPNFWNCLPLGPFTMPSSARRIRLDWKVYARYGVCLKRTWGLGRSSVFSGRAVWRLFTFSNCIRAPEETFWCLPCDLGIMPLHHSKQIDSHWCASHADGRLLWEHPNNSVKRRKKETEDLPCQRVEGMLANSGDVLIWFFCFVFVFRDELNFPNSWINEKVFSKDLDFMLLKWD